MLAEHFISGLLALLFVISGIGILLFKNWGRILAIVVAAVKLLLCFKDIVLMIFAISAGAETMASEQRFVFNVTTGLCVFFVILTMIYPAVVFVLLLRKTTREVFRKKDIDGYGDVRAI